jgi:Glyoxalase/Bleomycin resistance protein/Dioxygenase superfamily
MSASVTFDHLAVGVRSWQEGSRRFARELGGQWSHGGDAGEFAPCQLVYRHGIRVELISPGRAADGFMHRFIERGGPGPHHLTFKVRSLPAVLDEIARLGIGVLGGRTELPFWQEAFLHPRQCGIGTLLQLAQIDDDAMSKIGRGTPPPDGFPVDQEPARAVAWVGLAVESLDRARDLFAGALQGDVTEDDEGWARITWGPGRDLLVRSPGAAPGYAALWTSDEPGVAHVVFGPAEMTVNQVECGDAQVHPMTFDEATAVPVWLVADGTVEQVR